MRNTKTIAKPRPSENIIRKLVEYALLAMSLSVIALRTTYTEGPSPQTATLPINITDNVYSLALSCVLFALLAVWLVYVLLSRGPAYRVTAIEAGLSLFIASAVISTVAAANKRAAINDSAVLIAPIMVAVLLVQILDSSEKIRLTLVVIAALGVVSTCQCVYQLVVENRAWIDQYEQDPQSILGPLGIERGSFQQMLFEHRLYSRGVKGFFTTANSAGSFAILACFAAGALLLEKLKSPKTDPARRATLFACGFVLGANVFGLALTRSKGVIGAFLIVLLMFAAYSRFASWLKAHRKQLVILCLLLALVVGLGMVLYGARHERLPGGNSMLVRWQYWAASARMYAEHPFTGIGPGNFASYYTRYKPAAALESVADPHNFVLRILTQYGPLGLLGFIAMILLPLRRILFVDAPGAVGKYRGPRISFAALAAAFAAVISAVLLTVRLVMISFPQVDTPDLMLYTFFALYGMPVVVFCLGVWFLTAGEKHPGPLHANLTTAALVCAVLGVLIHNLVDFAIFEPGVYTAFWTVLACIVALDLQARPTAQYVPGRAWPLMTPAAAAVILLLGLSLFYGLFPVARAASRISRAMKDIGHAPELLDQAVQLDKLDPTAPNLAGRLYMRQYEGAEQTNTGLLARAESYFREAITRDPADFKNYENLARVYSSWAEASQGPDKEKMLAKAFQAALSAAEHYPGSGRLWLTCAKIAEQLGRKKAALEYYSRAVEIEDAYRAQFKQMYPDKELFSRLGEAKYQLAKQKAKALSAGATP